MIYLLILSYRLRNKITQRFTEATNEEAEEKIYIYQDAEGNSKTKVIIKNRQATSM